jgi:hypothetical protein
VISGHFGMALLFTTLVVREWILGKKKMDSTNEVNDEK